MSINIVMIETLNNHTMYKLLLLARGLILGSFVLGQMESKQYNYTKSTDNVPMITAEMYHLTPKEYHDHPEFGKFAFNAPRNNYFEQIHDRTDSTKLYVDHNSN